VTRTDKKTSIRYFITDCESEQAAYNLALATAPNTLELGGPGVMLIESIEIEPLGNTNFYGLVSYSTAKPEEDPTAGDSPEQTETGGTPNQGEGNAAPGSDPQAVISRNWSFSTGGGTQHITHSITTVATYVPDGADVPNHNGAINVSSTGIGGVDIHTPEPRLRLKQLVPNMTIGRFVRLCWCACKMNQNQFQGFWPRELLFMGVEGPEADGNGQRELVYDFAYSPTEAGFTIGEVVVTLKQGWDYLWVEYKQSEDGSGFQTLEVVAVHVEQVYDEIDFATQLGITNVE